MSLQLLITCEHAGNRVPPEYAHLFCSAREVLASHRGYDPGALELAKAFAFRLDAPLRYSTISRLLVELNRSLGHRALFSEFTSGLDAATQVAILERYYRPHRSHVEERIAQFIRNGEAVMHVSVHSFTPVLNGEVRSADVGLLYDPARSQERDFCGVWQQTLQAARPDLSVRRNYPYLGKSDGLTTHLRRLFDSRQYVGIELEINQLWPQQKRRQWPHLQRDVIDTFQLSVQVARDFDQQGTKQLQ